MGIYHSCSLQVKETDHYIISKSIYLFKNEEEISYNEKNSTKKTLPFCNNWFHFQPFILKIRAVDFIDFGELGLSVLVVINSKLSA